MNKVALVAKNTGLGKLLLSAAALYCLIIGISLSYNVYTSFFPIGLFLTHDEAEHLHVAYLLSEGERPYLDFIENHPTLFNHYLRLLWDVSGASTTREWALYARITVFTHFLLALIIFVHWISRLLSARPRGFLWAGLLVFAWGMVGLDHAFLHWIWHIRPDWICYAYTLLGCYLFYRHFETRSGKTEGSSHALLLVLGGVLMGVGNAIIPKGVVLILAFFFTVVTHYLIGGSRVPDGETLARYGKDCGVFVLACGVSFLGAVLLDCHLGQITVNQWISGVFRLNQWKHIVYTSAENNPVTSLALILSLSLPLLLLMGSWIFWEVSRLRQENEDDGIGNLLVFCIFAVVVNLFVGSYTNGVTWAYYFMPSLLAAAAIYVAFFTRVYHLMAASEGKPSSRLGICGLAVLVGVVVIYTMGQPIESLMRHKSRKVDAREVAIFAPSDYLPDEALPPEAVYFARFPQDIPIRAHHWGYYFMLAGDQDMWRDSCRVGLGPDPAEVWNSGFGPDPPDAIVFSDHTRIAEFILHLQYCQHVKAGWLVGAIDKDYVPMHYKQLNIYVRHEKVPYFQEHGWRADDSHDRPLLSSTFLRMLTKE